MKQGSRTLPVVDTPPKSGTWVDVHDQPLTEAEIAAGNLLGERINPDDHDDNGMRSV